MRKSTKRIAVLNVTSRCNLRCGFCFGPENGVIPSDGRRGDRVEGSHNFEISRPNKIGTQFVTPELTTQQAKNQISNLKKSGAKILIFSGGEPLLRSDIFKLICFAKKQGFYTVLHTNGMLINKLKVQNSKLNSLLAVTPKRVGVTRESALLCLNQINLPLDGYNTKTNDAMRCEGHFKKVMAALQLLKNTPVRVIIGSEGAIKTKFLLRPSEPIRLVISTVATAKNKGSVPKIGAILPKWVYKWRIFQFNPQGKAAAVKKEFAISDNEFKEISRQARNLTKNSRFKVQCIGVKNEEFQGSYEVI